MQPNWQYYNHFNWIVPRSTESAECPNGEIALKAFETSENMYVLPENLNRLYILNNRGITITGNTTKDLEIGATRPDMVVVQNKSGDYHIISDCERDLKLSEKAGNTYINWRWLNLDPFNLPKPPAYASAFYKVIRTSNDIIPSAKLVGNHRNCFTIIVPVQGSGWEQAAIGDGERLWAVLTTCSHAWDTGNCRIQIVQ